MILGYAFNDNNLKSIFNNYKEFSQSTLASPNVILVTRRRIDRHIKELYKDTYNMRVLDGVEIDKFFEILNEHLPRAKSCKERSQKSIQAVMKDGSTSLYNKDYLRSSDSFFEIFNAMISSAYNFNSKEAQTKFLDIFEKKRSLTGENSAWNQYRDLATWLTYFLINIDISNFHNKNEFLEIISFSLEKMSAEKRLGYSWEAYSIWQQHWDDILAVNRKLIKEKLEEKVKNISFIQ